MSKKRNLLFSCTEYETRTQLRKGCVPPVFRHVSSSSQVERGLTSGRRTEPSSRQRRGFSRFSAPSSASTPQHNQGRQHHTLEYTRSHNHPSLAPERAQADTRDAVTVAPPFTLAKPPPLGMSLLHIPPIPSHPLPSRPVPSRPALLGCDYSIANLPLLVLAV